MTPHTDQKIRILLIEDSTSDATLFRRSLQTSSLTYTLDWIEDGEKALALLRQQGEYQQAARPDLIILDLNLPRLDGRDVLKTIKRDSVLKRIPVVVLTTSSSERDIMQSYDLYANCYVIKPFDIEDFMAIAKLIEDFWLRTVSLPRLQNC